MLESSESDDFSSRKTQLAIIELPTIGIFLAGLIVAAVTFGFVDENQKHYAVDRFRETSEQISVSLERIVKRTEDSLSSITAFFAGSDNATRDQFRIFVTTAMSDRVGIQALEWIPRVSGSDREAFERAARTDGLKEFTFRQIGDGGMVPASRRAEYYPVYYVEPLAKNEKALGFDLASNQIRKSALELARDTGAMVSSARITLVQESAKQAGVVVFAPIYSDGKIPKTLEGRRRGLNGFGLGVFRVGDLLQFAISSAASDDRRIVALYDAADTDNASPLHVIGLDEPEKWPSMSQLKLGQSYEKKIVFAGREWRLLVATKSGNFASKQPWLPWISAVGVFLIVVLAGFYVYTIARRREYAEALVRERTHDLEFAASVLRSSEERLHAVVEHIADGIITISDDGIIQTVNPATIDMFGYTSEHLVGRNVKILMPEPYRGAHDTYLQNYAKTGIAKIIGSGREVEGLRANGLTFPMELQVTELQLGGDRLYLGLVRDITERKEADRLKNQFVSTVSHELRTPLTSIRGSLGMVESGALREPEQVSQMISLAVRNTERLINLVNDLLDIEKLQSGDLEFKFQDVDIRALTESAIETNQPYATEHGVELELSATTDGVVVNGDPDRLMQVLVNLISNAAKFSPNAGLVRVSSVLHGRSVRVSVSDQGGGIPDHFRGEIFTRFAQADSTDTRQKGGTGLGLSISKAIIEKHGGEIGFETKTGVGTTFYFDLPVRVEADDPAWNEIGLPSSSEKQAGQKQGRVLVLEDEPDVAKLLRAMLESDGNEVEVAANAKEARELLSAKHFDLMTVDIMLPDEDGIGLIRELRTQRAFRDLKTVIVSAKAGSDQYEVVTEKMGIVDWLDKPIDQARLLSAVQGAIGARSGPGMPRVLHIEDDKDLCQVMMALIGNTMDYVFVQSLSDARRIINAQKFDIVIIDPGMPDGSGIDMIPELAGTLCEDARTVIYSSDDLSTDLIMPVDRKLLKSRNTTEELLSVIRQLTADRSDYRRGQ